MEMYFADVGQGTCNVVLLGGRQAIVIDTGRRAADLRLLLNRYGVEFIACLVISHLDSDHADGATSLLTEFRGRIGKVCYPSDHRFDATCFNDKLDAEIKAGHMLPSQLFRLEREETAKTAWESKADDADLKIFSPTFRQNQQATKRKDANGTSGVLVLRVGVKRVVFPGDSSIEQWEAIRNERQAPLECDVISVPHHGGIIWPNHWDDAKVAAKLQWLYEEAVRPRHAVVSVGTSNGDEHPKTCVISALTAAGARILCTQITHKCCSNLRAISPGLIPITVPSRSGRGWRPTRSGNGKDIACAGTVVAEISPASVRINRCDLHHDAVIHLGIQKHGTPLCKPLLVLQSVEGTTPPIVNTYEAEMQHQPWPPPTTN